MQRKFENHDATEPSRADSMAKSHDLASAANKSEEQMEWYSGKVDEVLIEAIVRSRCKTK